MERDDDGIVRDALAGGETARAAFDRLWRSYYRRIVAFAATFPGIRPADREDAAADAVIEAFRGLHRHDRTKSLNAWMYGVARLQFLARARKTRREAARAIDTPEGFDCPDGSARAFEDDDEARRCREALDALPPEDRRIALLRYYEDLDASDIGNILALPAGTVRWRLTRIRESIRAKLEGSR